MMLKFNGKLNLWYKTTTGMILYTLNSMFLGLMLIIIRTWHLVFHIFLYSEKDLVDEMGFWCSDPNDLLRDMDFLHCHVMMDGWVTSPVSCQDGAPVYPIMAAEWPRGGICVGWCCVDWALQFTQIEISTFFVETRLILQGSLLMTYLSPVQNKLQWSEMSSVKCQLFSIW